VTRAVADPDAVLERVRSICLGFPGTGEKLSHGANSFFVRGKMFLTFVDDHHRDGNLAVWCKSSLDDQKRLVAGDPDQFFVPPYVGVKGWVGVRLNRPSTDWIGLAILVEEGWLASAPKSLVEGDRHVPSPPPGRREPPPVRGKTDAAVASAALAKLAAICLALPEATQDPDTHHPTFRVRKKPFAYFLDNHHGDGIIAACVRAPKTGKGNGASLIKGDPKRFYSPEYLGHNGWVAVRVDARRVDWKDLGERVAQSYRATAPTRPKSPAR
jgi:hypothetical protein